MLASPPRAVRVALSFGCPARRVCFLAPMKRVTSFGRNFNASQPEVWNGTEPVTVDQADATAGLAPPPASAAVAADLSQEVGFRVNSFLLRSIAIDLMLSWLPPKTSGIGSETAVTWVDSGSTNSATLTTTVPRSKGPAVAGVITARES